MTPEQAAMLQHYFGRGLDIGGRTYDLATPEMLPTEGRLDWNMEPAGFEEVFDPNAGYGQDAEQMELYEQLFKLFVPEYQEPSAEFRKENLRRGMMAAGAGMMSGRDLMEGMARGGAAFQDSMYKGKQDERNRLDLRSREDSLAKYRGMTASAQMDRNDALRKKNEYDMLNDAFERRAGVNAREQLKAMLPVELHESIDRLGPEEAMYLLRSHLGELSDDYIESQKPDELDPSEWDSWVLENGRIGYTSPKYPGAMIRGGTSETVARGPKPDALTILDFLRQSGQFGDMAIWRALAQMYGGNEGLSEALKEYIASEVEADF